MLVGFVLVEDGVLLCVFASDDCHFNGGTDNENNTCTVEESCFGCYPLDIAACVAFSGACSCSLFVSYDSFPFS